MLASAGMFKGPDGKRAIDGCPQTIRQTCEDSLQRLNTDVIDLYYLHRRDKSVPIEESIGELLLGWLTKANQNTPVYLRYRQPRWKRHTRSVPIAAVQSEYSLWSIRNAEIAVIDKCQELGSTSCLSAL
ncbi:aldo/keto reductase [Vibrio chagasii]|nr:aldo/keto reductase [Vibrio chagasii]